MSKSTKNGREKVEKITENGTKTKKINKREGENWTSNEKRWWRYFCCMSWRWWMTCRTRPSPVMRDAFPCIPFVIFVIHFRAARTTCSFINLPTDLAFINSYCAYFPEAINNLETRGLSLHAQVNIVEHLRMQIANIPGARGAMLRRKSDDVFTKNGGYLALQDLSHALTEDITPASGISTDPCILSAYTHAPLVSVEVERSFSEYNYLLSDRRHNFTPENIEKHLVIMHNAKFLWLLM